MGLRSEWSPGRLGIETPEWARRRQRSGGEGEGAARSGNPRATAGPGRPRAQAALAGPGGPHGWGGRPRHAQPSTHVSVCIPSIQAGAGLCGAQARVLAANCSQDWWGPDPRLPASAFQPSQAPSCPPRAQPTSFCTWCLVVQWSTVSNSSSRLPVHYACAVFIFETRAFWGGQRRCASPGSRCPGDSSRDLLGRWPGRPTRLPR